MTYTATAAAYGIFQVVFADLTQRLANATFLLASSHDPSGTRERVDKLPFEQMLRRFRKELEPFHQRSSTDEPVHALTHACSRIDELSAWRNERVHASVVLHK